jgi:hypothetical protein
MLKRAAPHHPKSIPSGLAYVTLASVLHTRDLWNMTPEQRLCIKQTLREPPQGEGIVCQSVTPAGLIADDDAPAAFFIPDYLMLKILKEECLARKIMLPKKASKMVREKLPSVRRRFMAGAGIMAGSPSMKPSG